MHGSRAKMPSGQRAARDRLPFGVSTMRTRLIPILAMFAASPAVTSDQHVVSESKSPIVSDALDRGRQADVSGHSAALPVLYQLSLQPIEQISPWYSGSI
jgi:hypothetical protein